MLRKHKDRYNMPLVKDLKEFRTCHGCDDPNTNKLTEAQKTLGLKKFGPGKLRVEKLWAQNIFMDSPKILSIPKIEK